MLLLSGAATVAGLSLAMALAWRTRMRTGQSGWIDAIWSAATGLAAFVLALAPPSPAPIGRRALAAGLILVWAARLAGHISARTRGAGDDPRYAALAREWGADFPRRLFVFLQIQAAAALPLVGAVALAARAPRPFPDLFDLAAILVAAAALAGEAMADAQLAKFRREAPSGGLCEIGLWRFSRHPNYFFEFLFWCAWPAARLRSVGRLSAGPARSGRARLDLLAAGPCQRRSAAGKAYARLARRGVRGLRPPRQRLLSRPPAQLNKPCERVSLGASMGSETPPRPQDQQRDFDAEASFVRHQLQRRPMIERLLGMFVAQPCRGRRRRETKIERGADGFERQNDPGQVAVLAGEHRLLILRQAGALGGAVEFVADLDLVADRSPRDAARRRRSPARDRAPRASAASGDARRKASAPTSRKRRRDALRAPSRAEPRARQSNRVPPRRQTQAT